MPVSVLGINHKTAPVEIREKVAFEPSSLQEALPLLLQNAALEEVAVLSTCNRMEVYFRGGDEATQRLKQSLIDYHTLEQGALDHCLYDHQDKEAVAHMMRVASGLDSMVLGEPQVLGQMKDAFHQAKQAGTVGTLLNKLFQQTFSVAKKVRTDTEIGSSAVSVAYAAVTLAKKIFTDLKQSTALFVGAGETIELAARHLHNQGVNNIIVANRTLSRAEELAAQFSGKAISLSHLHEWLAKADIVIASTASPLPVIGKGMVEHAVKQRRHKPMFMVDLAVPRDIETEVGQLKDVYLYSVDDLKEVIEENIKARAQAAEEAEDIVVSQSEQFMVWIQSLRNVDLVKDYRTRYERLKQAEVERALLLLQQGENAEIVVQQLAHRLTNKFMHAPTRYLREADKHHDTQSMSLMRRVLGINELED
ncbi:glutamyl-tRNA reductase [Pleionea sp. CnH1-48]|uniref:glutamyl-tRNA reductase n=1 Tax=Pleionea sp. CnH1-48 TaxID=2954494 RepID=UPI0020979C26|nr:glutamyl-tRNA reductase [Pleionea sp. CnH1-48]MCO7224094.1 glutamyl-tRNA reductase [Pleionea sp. CnH1-48]